jgi:hypothetical protein
MNFLLAHPWNVSVVNATRLRRVSNWDEIVGALCGD